MAMTKQRSEIFIEVCGKHTAVILYSKDLPTGLEKLDTLPYNNGSRYIRFGWGDEHYYGSDKKTVKMAMEALLIKTNAVMEVSYLDTLPAQPSRTYHVPLTQDQLARIQHFIQRHFIRNAAGHIISQRKNKQGDHYYPAIRQYHLFQNCNNWTTELLIHTDRRFKHRRAFLPALVERQLQKNRYQTVGQRKTKKQNLAG